VVRAVPAKRRPLERPGPQDHSSVIDELWRWARSLPWVVERPLAPSDGRCLTVDCPPLGSLRAWLLVPPAGEVDEPLELHVVLPWRVGHRGIAVGWGVLVTELGDDRLVVAVAVPTTSSELRALEALVVVAYEEAFVGSGPPSGR
jgi:hypothetical protein